MYGSLTAYDMFASVRRQVDKGMLGPATEPPGPPRASSVNFPYMVVRCKDGQWLQMANMAARLFPLWIGAMGLSTSTTIRASPALPSFGKISATRSSCTA